MNTRLRNLSYDKGKGWIFRFTITANQKQVGKRMKRYLKTHDIDEAIARRDLLVDEYRKLGFDILQKSPAENTL